MTVQDYLDLIPSANANQPNFTAMISQLTGLLVYIQGLFSSMVPLFDLSTPPVGNQLDIIGQWVGVTRNVNIPIEGVYFSWDGDDAGVGWDYGTWQPYNAPSTITTLPDDAYLTLIRAKIAANNWDGTIDGAYEIWDAVFPTFTILIQDHQNMTYALAIIGGIVDSLTLALITGGYIPLRPEGVLITEYFVSTDSNPAFAWDVESPPSLAGWDEGSWLRELAPT